MSYFVVFVVGSHALYYFLVESPVREWEVELEMEWEVFNRSRTILLRTFFFRFIYTLPFETSGTALCGTAGTLTPVFSNEVMTFGVVHPPFMACGEPEQKRFSG